MRTQEMGTNKANRDRPPLDRWRLDEVLTRKPEKLWGLAAIAEALGIGVDKARELARQDGVPIYRPAGSRSYFAFRTELMAWLRGKSPHENQ